MTTASITFRAIAPLYSPLNLKLGVNQFDAAFIHELKILDKKMIAADIDTDTDTDTDTAANSEVDKLELDCHGQFLHVGGQQSEGLQYLSTKENSKDVRLMCWQPEPKSSIQFHVFSNNIAIAELAITIELPVTASSTDGLVISASSDAADNSAITEQKIKALEDQVQNLAEMQIQQHFNHFCQDLAKLKPYLGDHFTCETLPMSANVTWVARTMVVEQHQLKQPYMTDLLTLWLQHTSRPEDAAEIIAGNKQYSMTWLNYVVVNAKGVGEDPLVQMMVLAQYYYVAQEHCNSDLRSAIETAYAENKQHKIAKTLAKTRTSCRLNQIAFYENIKFLNQPNRALLENILNGWKFEQLVENSDRMIAICNARLEEEDHKKRERSTVMTDLLLVTLSFFTVFELSLYLTEFSREMMSRPALDYNDTNSSFFLGFIAEIDADIMFSFGFGLTLILILVYRYIKRN